MNNNVFLFEIYGEAIPAKMQLPAIESAEKTISLILKEFNCLNFNVEVKISPMRISLLIKNFEDEIIGVCEEVRGPRINSNNEALNGFLRKHEIEKSELKIVDGHYSIIRKPQRVTFKKIIPEIIKKFLKKMPWPKSMRYTNPENENILSDAWVRPIRNIMVLLNEEEIVFNLKNFGVTTNGNTFKGRFLMNDKISVNSAKNYVPLLRDNFVIVDYFERKKYIEKLLQQKAEEKNLKIIFDEDLLNEITGLVESPHILLGEINKEFMSLPKPVILTTLKVHQKFFLTENHLGEMLPFFVAICNVKPNETIKSGLEKVLRARLSDAAFFFSEDLKIPLKERVSSLSKLTYHVKLGSMLEKVRRLQIVSPELSEVIEIFKSDLQTGLVIEFNELEGVMGEIYAINSGFPKEMAAAIREHHMPKGIADEIPKTINGKKLSVIDKCDALIGFFGVQLKRSGAGDPFALRRAAIGIIRILSSESNLLNLYETLQSSIQSYKENQNIIFEDSLILEVMNFILDRLEVYVKDSLNYNFGNAAISILRKKLNNGNGKEINLNKFMKIIGGVNENINLLEDVLQIFKRLNGFSKEKIKSEFIKNVSFCESIFEKNLFEKIEKETSEILLLIKSSEYSSAFKKIASSKKSLDDFCDSFQIFSLEENVKMNRISLLKNFLNLLKHFLDFELLN